MPKGQNAQKSKRPKVKMPKSQNAQKSKCPKVKTPKTQNAQKPKNFPLNLGFSTASLDEEDSAFCSAESSPSCSITSSSPESSPNKTINEKTPQIAFEWKWTELQKEKIEGIFEGNFV